MDKIRENAEKYFEEELSGEPLYQDLVIDWLTEFAEKQVKLFAIPDVSQQRELLLAFMDWYDKNVENRAPMTGNIVWVNDFLKANNCC